MTRASHGLTVSSRKPRLMKLAQINVIKRRYEPGRTAADPIKLKANFREYMGRCCTKSDLASPGFGKFQAGAIYRPMSASNSELYYVQNWSFWLDIKILLKQFSSSSEKPEPAEIAYEGSN